MKSGDCGNNEGEVNKHTTVSVNLLVLRILARACSPHVKQGNGRIRRTFQ